MFILFVIIFGALAGWLASILMGTNEQQGAMGNIATGVLGALLAGVVANLLGGSGVTGFNAYSLILAILGASVVTWAFQSARQ